MTDTLAVISDKIPAQNRDTWTIYPQYITTQQTSMLFDFQHIEWLPYETDRFTVEHPAFNVEGYPGSIYTAAFAGDHLDTYVAINKGELKWIAHAPHGTYDFEDDVRGSLELRIGAFITTVYKKFSGIVSFESYGENIVAISMSISSDLITSLNDDDLVKNIKRLYTRREWK